MTLKETALPHAPAASSGPDALAQQTGIRLFDVPVPATLKDHGIDRVVLWATALTVKFRGITVREGMLLHGPAGWGEFSPFWDYKPAESATWLSAGLEAATQTLPPPKRNFVSVNVTIPVVTPEKAKELVVTSGCTTAKVKVADTHSSLDDDIARVQAVREALGPNGKIRVDANGAWTTVDAQSAIKRLADAAGGLEYVEQPCQTVNELAQLRPRIDVPIAADESVRRAADPLAVAKAQAADILVIKAQPLGGVRRALEIVEAAGLPAVVSSALDSSIGIALGARLAACLPSLDFACGLGTVRLFSGDVCATPRIPREGVMAVDRATVDVPVESLIETSAAGSFSGKSAAFISPDKSDAKTSSASETSDNPIASGLIGRTLDSLFIQQPPTTLDDSVPTLVRRWSARLDATIQALNVLAISTSSLSQER